MVDRQNQSSDPYFSLQIDVYVENGRNASWGLLQETTPPHCSSACSMALGGSGNGSHLSFEGCEQKQHCRIQKNISSLPSDHMSDAHNNVHVQLGSESASITYRWQPALALRRWRCGPGRLGKSGITCGARWQGYFVYYAVLEIKPHHYYLISCTVCIIKV